MPGKKLENMSLEELEAKMTDLHSKQAAIKEEMAATSREISDRHFSAQKLVNMSEQEVSDLKRLLQRVNPAGKGSEGWIGVRT